MVEPPATETLETLRRVGLTEYESKAYHALLGLGRADAKSVAGEAGIPPTRVHEVLKDLRRKEWVTSESGRPIVFIPREPGERLQRAWREVTQSYETAREDLEQAHAGRTMAAASPVWFVRGEDAVGEKTRELVEGARDQVTVDLPYLLPFDEVVFLPSLRKAARRGRRVRVLVSPDLDVDPTAAHWARLLQDGVEIRCMPLQLRRVLTDFEQGIVVAPRGDQAEIVAIWNPVREVVQMLGPSYDGVWERAEPIVDEAGGGKPDRM